MAEEGKDYYFMTDEYRRRYGEWFEKACDGEIEGDDFWTIDDIKKIYEEMNRRYGNRPYPSTAKECEEDEKIAAEMSLFVSKMADRKIKERETHKMNTEK